MQSAHTCLHRPIVTAQGKTTVKSQKDGDINPIFTAASLHPWLSGAEMGLCLFARYYALLVDVAGPNKEPMAKTRYKEIEKKILSWSKVL